MPALTALTLATLLSAPAAAQSVDDAAEEEQAPAAVVLQHVPARFSVDGGIHVSYGFLPQFVGNPAWVGFGGRVAWGRNWGDHRVGFNAQLALEGPIGIEWTNNLEVGVMWDWVNPKGLYLAAGIGPALFVNAEQRDTSGYDVTVDPGAYAAMRIGWSQRFSLVARRFYVALEPKFRMIGARPAFVASIVFGSGRGF